MASVYPGGIDNFPTRGADPERLIGPDVDNDYRDALNKIEAELGIDPSGPGATVAARLAAAFTALDGKANTSHTHALSALTQSGATAGQVPTWSGSAWTPEDPTGGGGGIGVSVADHGATGDGSTNDTTAINNAIAAVISAGGGIVYFPEGTYLCNQLVIGGSNVTLMGEGWSSILRQPLSTSANQYLVAAYGTTTNTTGNRRNLAFRDLALEGRSHEDAADFPDQQFIHLLALSGVSDVLIERCRFFSFRGDGIYLGSQSSAGTAAERHNERITVRSCLFDGNGKNNRNGISVIDGTDVWIVGNHFTDCSSIDDLMPGAIDVEPNNNAYHRARGIYITDNTFENVGGVVGNICVDIVPSQATLTIPAQGFHIARNTIRADANTTSAIFVRQPGTISDSTPPIDVRVEGNDIAAAVRGVYAEGVRGVSVRDNTIVKGTQAAVMLGWTRVIDADVEDNRIRVGATTGGSAISLMNVNRVQIEDNKIRGTLDRIIGLDTGTGGTATSDNIDVIDNKASGTIGAFSSKNASHTTSRLTNAVRGNKAANLVINSEHFDGGDRASTVPSVASAATLTLPAGVSRIEVTGTTTITSITASHPDRIVILRFPSACQVTWGSNLNLNGNFNANGTGAHDSLVLSCDGTNWTEISRTVG